jgi:hypothetical protein
MSFLLYISFFYMPEYLTGIRLLHTDVGPVRPVDYARNRRRPRPEVAAFCRRGTSSSKGTSQPGRLRGSLDELSGTSLHSLAQSRWQR